MLVVTITSTFTDLQYHSLHDVVFGIFAAWWLSFWPKRPGGRTARETIVNFDTGILLQNFIHLRVFATDP